MARLFGLIGNRADLAGRVLLSEAEVLKAKAGSTQLGWGVGFYQGGEVLMRRRPIDDRPVIDVARLTGDVRADLMIGHVRSATVGSLRTENTHPFRYRQWLFEMTGTLPAFESIRERLLASVPEFLRSSIRGETDAEILFYVFLSFVHDAGRLNEAIMAPAHVRDALRSCLAVVDGMAAEVGGEPSKVNLMASDGETLFAVHCGAEMGYRTYAGKSDADALIGEDVGLRRKTPELSQMHFTLVAGDFEDDQSLTSSTPGALARWHAIPERAIVTIERGLEPQIEDLRAGVLVTALGLGAVACVSSFDTQTGLPRTPRHPDGVALEPAPAMPQTRDHAEARGVVALREPLADKDVEDVIRAYIRAFEREDELALLQLITPDAVPLGRPNGSRQMLVELWRVKMRSFEYQRLAGLEIARLAEVERRSFDDVGGPNEPAKPPEMRPGDLYVRVPIAMPRLGSEQLFGDILVLLLRREDGRLKIAGQADENAS